MCAGSAADDAKIGRYLVELKGTNMKLGLRGVVSIGTGIARRAVARFPSGPFRMREKANRSTRITVDRFDLIDGIGGEWAAPRYGDYYATSAAVHAAVRTRADAVGRPPLWTADKILMS